MKNFTLIIIAIMFGCDVNAQVVNNSFENWQTDTAYFSGFEGVLPADTFTYLDPAGWTSSNALTTMPALGGRSLVTLSSNAVYGNYSVQVITDTLAKVEGTQLTIPGYLLNGSYQLNVASLILGENITPISVKGAGQPFDQRLADFKGYYKYAPVFNPNTGGNDTCLIWATLRKGEELIADAIFKSTDSTTGYQWFQVPFNYVSCDMPDTLVILISSSIPNIPSLFNGGASKLVVGSVLKVDTLSYDTLAPGTVIGAFALADTSSTNENTPVNIFVKANDQDCDTSLDLATLSVVAQPRNGTASVGPASAFITYTPDTGFSGTDTFYYNYNDGISSSNIAPVVVVVAKNTGIIEIPQIAVLVYPVPASDELNIRFENSGNTTAKIYDMIGNLAGIFHLNGNSNMLPLTKLGNGAYNLQLINGNSQVFANTRFVINR